ncbi:MAG: hypothetical protein J0L79_05795 [Rickettsiales bacterium]|nr:hypothetical protein [Rickettsiales bacterium]
MSKSDEEVRPAPNEGFEEYSLADGMAQLQGVVPYEQEFYLDPDGGFIAYSREDKWSSISYDKRYLDALASVLLISHKDNNKVAAITQVGGDYCLAYNDARHGTFEQNYESKLLELLECLNTRNWPKLLALHILYNKVDFLEKLDSCEFPLELVDLPKLKSKLKADSDRVPETKKAIVSMKKQLETIKKIEGAKSIIEIIKCAFEQIDTISVDSVYKTYVDLLASLPREVKRPTGYSELINPSDEIRQTILRPLQNVVKLAGYIEEKLPELELELKSDEKPGGNLIFLDDEEAKLEGIDEVHAEVRLAHYLNQRLQYVEGFYIGSSRLCCAGCHRVLDDGGYEHRGTSGMFFPGWKVDKDISEKLTMSAVEHAKGKSLLSQEIEYTKGTRCMQRDLSEDPDDEKTVIEGVSLLEIKKGLKISETYIRLREKEEKGEKETEEEYKRMGQIGIGEGDVSLSGESTKTPESDE